MYNIGCNKNHFFLRIADSTFNSRNGISISTASRQYTRQPKLCAAQSLPMAVPIFSQRNEKDYDEVSVRHPNSTTNKTY